MDPRHLSLRQLEVLKAVAETGSMAQAGRRLFMTGPGITQQVQQLEKTLGMPVFDRLGRRLQLTAAGERALAAANEVHSRLGVLAKEMDALRKRDDGTLHLGILATATHILPPLLAEFRRRAPGIAVHMAVSSREELSRHVLDGDVDLALMGRGAETGTEEAAASGRLVREPFASNPHVIIAWPGHPLAARARHRADRTAPRERGAARARLRHARDARRVPRHAPHRAARTHHRERQRDGQARGDVAARHQPHLDAHAVPGAEDRRAGAARRGPHADRAHLVRGVPPDRWLPPAAAAFRDYLLDEGAHKVEAETRSAAVVAAARRAERPAAPRTVGPQR